MDESRIEEKLDAIQAAQGELALKVQSVDDRMHSSPCAELISHRQWHTDEERYRWDKIKLLITVSIPILTAATSAIVTMLYLKG